MDIKTYRKIEALEDTVRDYFMDSTWSDSVWGGIQDLKLEFKDDVDSWRVVRYIEMLLEDMMDGSIKNRSAAYLILYTLFDKLRGEQNEEFKEIKHLIKKYNL